MNQYSIIAHDYGMGQTAQSIPGVESDSITVAICDPPYNIGKIYADDETGDCLNSLTYEMLMDAALTEIYDALKPGGVCFLWCNAEQGRLFWDLAIRLGYEMLWDTPIIWWERFSQYQKKRLTKDFRFIFPLRKPGADTKFYGEEILVESERMRLGDKRSKGSKGKVPGRVWLDDQLRDRAVDIFSQMLAQMTDEEVDSAICSMDTGNLKPFLNTTLPGAGRVWLDRRLQGTSKDRVDWHPLQLPPEQIRRVIKGFSLPGDSVLDAFAGSGNSAEEALNLGRDFYGVDKSPTYRTKIERRIEQRCPNAEKIQYL